MITKIAVKAAAGHLARQAVIRVAGTTLQRTLMGNAMKSVGSVVGSEIGKQAVVGAAVGAAAGYGSAKLQGNSDADAQTALLRGAAGGAAGGAAAAPLRAIVGIPMAAAAGAGTAAALENKPVSTTAIAEGPSAIMDALLEIEPRHPVVKAVYQTVAETLGNAVEDMADPDE